MEIEARDHEKYKQFLGGGTFRNRLLEMIEAANRAVNKTKVPAIKKKASQEHQTGAYNINSQEEMQIFHKAINFIHKLQRTARGMQPSSGVSILME